jgi:hypothetical protein
MYNALILPDAPINKISNNKLWKFKIPLRIKVFGWYLHKGGVLTKDNLAKQNWHGNKICVFFSPKQNNKTLILPMSVHQIYMVSHPSSFNLVSAMQYYQYFWELAKHNWS